MRHLSAASDALAPWQDLLSVVQSPQDAKAAFTHSLRKYLLSAHYVPGSFPGIGELSTVNTREGACIVVHKTGNNHDNK